MDLVNRMQNEVLKGWQKTKQEVIHGSSRRPWRYGVRNDALFACNPDGTTVYILRGADNPFSLCGLKGAGIALRDEFVERVICPPVDDVHELKPTGTIRTFGKDMADMFTTSMGHPLAISHKLLRSMGYGRWGGKYKLFTHSLDKAVAVYIVDMTNPDDGIVMAILSPYRDAFVLGNGDKK